MLIKVSMAQLHGFQIEIDCEACVAIDRLGKVMKVDAVDVIRIALLNGLIDLKEKHLKKES